LILCDESYQGEKASITLPKILQNKAQNEEFVLIGPEGGFSKEEFAAMHAMKNLHSITLGKQILRADTAIIAALALVQEFI
jgi:16S rRNA (uracil1498-N3)-methyltransferase